MSTRLEPNTDPFLDSRQKLERAAMLIWSLDTLISKYRSREPVIHVFHEAPAHYRSSSIVVREPPPRDISSIFGDIIHNLRSSLDLLACGMAKLFGASDVRNVQFPFAASAEKLKFKIKKRGLNGLSAQLQRLLHDTKPYPGGNHWIVGIYELDLIDKHQALVPTSASFIAPGAGQMSYGDIRRVRAGARADSVWYVGPDALAGPPESDQVPKISFQFPKGPFCGQEIIGVLWTALSEFTRIVDVFEYEALWEPSAQTPVLDCNEDCVGHSSYRTTERDFPLTRTEDERCLTVGAVRRIKYETRLERTCWVYWVTHGNPQDLPGFIAGARYRTH